MQIKIWEYVVHDLNFSMRRMPTEYQCYVQQEHHQIQHYMDNDEYFKYGLSWSGSQWALSRAYVHPNSGCSIILLEREDNVYSSYKVDSYNVSFLLSSHWHYLPKNMLVWLSPHMGHTGNPSMLGNRHITESQKTKYWMYVTMQAITTVSQVGTQVVRLGYRTPSLLLLNIKQQVPNALSSVHLQQPAPHSTHLFPWSYLSSLTALWLSLSA